MLGELAGELALRPGTTRTAQFAYISQQFRTGGSAGNGTANKSGYLYMLHLSNATPGDSTAVGNDQDLGGNATTGGPAAAPLAISLQEAHFVVYAWPMELKLTGARAFFVNEVGTIYSTNMNATTYDGSPKRPDANAAYVNGGVGFSSSMSSGSTPGNDNNQWNPTG